MAVNVNDGTKRNSLPTCSICRVAQSAYCCPRCSVRTCSLKCCLEHKSRTGCNGKRDRTAFCSLARFTDAQLASDYHFLEDVLKCGERAGRFVRETMGGVRPASGRGRRNQQNGPAASSRSATTSASTTEQQPQQQDAPISPLLRLSMETGEKGEIGTDKCSAEYAQKEEEEEGEISEKQSSDDLAQKQQAKRQKLDSGSINSRKNMLICRQSSKGASARNLAVSEVAWLVKQPSHLKRLVRAAADRNITLLLMPAGMARRKENTTTYSPKQDVIRWRVEWKFHLKTPLVSDVGGRTIATEGSKECVEEANCDDPAIVSIVVDGIQESTSLSDLLSAQLDVDPAGKNRAARSKLRALASTTRSSLRILIKALPCSSSKPIFVELLTGHSLGEALKGLTIVEFPVLEVVREQDLGRFPRKIEEL